MKADSRFVVAPLASEPLTVTEAMKVLAEWMVADPETGPPAITVSKVSNDPNGFCPWGDDGRGAGCLLKPGHPGGHMVTDEGDDI